jgi:DNA-binding IclR family transcriptional regulator
VHYAVLDGRSVVYRSKVDPAHGAVRLSSTIGGRNPAHLTAVGKLLLAHALPDEAAVAEWVGRDPLEVRTPRSIGTVPKLHAELVRTRDRGYATDDQEAEPGINCLAVPAFLTSPASPSGAVSVSAVAFRMPLERLIAEAATIRSIVDDDTSNQGER